MVETAVALPAVHHMTMPVMKGRCKMYKVRASGQITLKCENCKAQDFASLDTVRFEMAPLSDNAVDGSETSYYGSYDVPCPNCDDHDMRLQLHVTVADGVISDFDTHPSGCCALESDVEIQSMIRVEPVDEPILPAPSCPACGSQMVKRTVQRGANAGSQFWGCSRYPNCRGTRPF